MEGGDMAFTAISKFIVSNQKEEEVKEAFKKRPGLVDEQEGFLGLNVLSPKDNPAEFWLITHWETEEHFRHWHLHHKKESHINIPKGLKLVKHSFELKFFDLITN